GRGGKHRPHHRPQHRGGARPARPHESDGAADASGGGGARGGLSGGSRGGRDHRAALGGGWRRGPGMNFFRVVEPAGWKRPRGYSNGILAKGRILFVAGQVGWDENQEFRSDDFGEQWDRALANVLEVVRAAGGGPEQVARMTGYVKAKKAYRAALGAVGESWRRRMGKHFPAMALVEVSDLLEDRALVEIEATCVLPEEE